MSKIQFVIGLDLAQVNDYTALAVLHRAVPEGGGKAAYDVVHLERMRQVPYPEVVRRVGALVARPELAGRCCLALDATGVGRPIVDLVAEARPGTGLHACTITSGLEARMEPGRGLVQWYIPKCDLVGMLQMLLGTGRLRIAAGLVLAGVLRAELSNFRTRTTAAANEVSGPWRESEHDDLVLATANFKWVAEHLPPAPGRLFALGTEPRAMLRRGCVGTPGRLGSLGPGGVIGPWPVGPRGT